MAFKPKDFTVWMEIPVSDMDRAVDLLQHGLRRGSVYRQFRPQSRWPCSNPQTKKPASPGIFTPANRRLKAPGPTIHLAVPGKLEDALKRAETAGGKVVSEPITIPAGRFAYTLDPDGNSVGLFETM